jgi:hypothetical protein
MGRNAAKEALDQNLYVGPAPVSLSAYTEQLLNYLSRKFGLTARPNHLGSALQRHRRAGRLEYRDHHWYLPPVPQKGGKKQSAATG